MKKRIILFFSLILLFSVSACDKEGEISSGNNLIVDPQPTEPENEDIWKIVDAKTIEGKIGNIFGTYEEFDDIVYRWNEKRQIAEMAFTMYGATWTARAAIRSEYENITDGPLTFTHTENESMWDEWLYHILGNESLYEEDGIFKGGGGAWYYPEKQLMLTLTYESDEYQSVIYAEYAFNLKYGLTPISGTSVSEQNDYPRTTIPIRLEDVNNYLCPSMGNVKMMIVPVSFTDGYEFNEEYFAKLRKKLDGVYPANSDRLSVKEYYKNASYNQLNIDYEIFPVVEVGKSSYETEASWEKAGEYARFYQNMFQQAKVSYTGDLGSFDSNKDGAVDILVFVFNDPSVDPDDTIGTLFGSKCTYNDDFAGKEGNLDFYIAVCMEYAVLTDECPDNMRNNLIHEIGHTLGLDDYYSFSLDYNSPCGGFDMQCYDIGDWNVYSKLAVGWIDPYIIEPETDSITLRIGSSALYPDLILIPTSKGLNGSVFDEYMLVDVLSWTGNNRMDWFMFMKHDPSDPCHTGGVRIIHVDSRLVRRYWNKNDFAYAIKDKFQKIEKDWGTAYYTLNTMTPGHTGQYGLSIEDPYSYVFQVMERKGKQHILNPDERYITSDLFTTGHSFSMKSHQAAFSKAPYTNNGGSFDYEICVDEYDPIRMEATITIKRIS